MTSDFGSTAPKPSEFPSSYPIFRFSPAFSPRGVVGDSWWPERGHRGRNLALDFLRRTHLVSHLGETFARFSSDYGATLVAASRFKTAESLATFCRMILPDLNLTVARAGMTKLLPG